MAARAFSVSTPNSARLAAPELREALLRYARRRLPPTEVDDLVQNTLTDALVSQNPPSDERDFQRWVHGIAKHKVADVYRRRGRHPLLDPELDGQLGSTDPGPATGELSQWIERELPKTDGAQATLHWLLRESDGESLDEIARDEALPAPRVRQRVSRLRRHLHSRWLALAAVGLALLLCVGVALHVWRSQTATPIAKDAVPSAHPMDSAATRPPVPSVPAPSLPAGSTPQAPQFAPSAKSNAVHSAPASKANPDKPLAPKMKRSPKSSKKELAPNDVLPSKSNVMKDFNANDYPVHGQQRPEQ
ncbi:MAG: sigma-70 family RNA polymerase sigma factor [Polyangiaceae bacterium]